MINKRQVSKFFGELLARRRSEAKLSQRDFGKAVGLSRTSITNIEQGRQPISLPTLYVMADVLQKEVCDLLPIIHPVATVDKHKLNQREQNQLNNLSTQELRWLSKIAEPRPGKGSRAGN
jgi:transcriptional regulator with XRE-family HTH domain